MSIDVNNVSKSFITKDKDFTAVKDINLHVDDGEFICLLGPSGCGKTTLLRMIGGLETPDSGEIYADGNLVEGPSKDRGFIFQQYSLFPWLNVLDNVTFGLNITENDKKEENIQAAERYLDRVGLSDFKYSYPHELSGGMKQRQNRHSLQEQLLGVWKRFETTIVFVTHDVDEAVFLADKIVIMDKNPGRIQQIVEVDLPRIRKRDSKEFLELLDYVESLLGVWED